MQSFVLSSKSAQFLDRSLEPVLYHVHLQLTLPHSHLSNTFSST